MVRSRKSATAAVCGDGRPTILAVSNSVILGMISVQIAVCLTALPAQAKYSGGTGEPNDPYQIATAADLIALGETPQDYDKHFILTADIDLYPHLPGRKVFDKAVIAPRVGDDIINPLGTDFTGNFDGKGHTIKNLTISGGTGGFLGLFGQVWGGGRIHNVCLENADIKGASGSSCLGGLVGCNVGDTLSDCFWNVETSALSESDGGIGLTTAQMRDPNTFVRAGWDFVDIPDDSGGIWAQPMGGGFPILWWQLPESQRPPLPSFSGGTGQPDDPYLISTAGALNRIGGNPRLLKAHFKLIADIDLKDVEFLVIGSGVFPFTGVFDGNGHTISGFTQISTDTGYGGLFAYIDGLNAAVKNLGLIAPHVETETAWDVGALVGRLDEGTITNCYVQDGNVSGRSYRSGQEDKIYGGLSTAGGLVGASMGTMIDCRATCSVFGSRSAGGLAGMSDGTIINCTSSGNVSGNTCVGGLLGTNEANGEVAGCSSTGNVLAIYLFTEAPSKVLGHWQTEPKGLRAGGLVGDNTGRIVNSCARGDVSGSDIAGGVVGSNGYIQRWDVYYEAPGEIINSYSTGAVSGTSDVGGLVGLHEVGSVTACFWDTETSGQVTSAAGTDKTTAQMQTARTFLNAGWDFVGETDNGTEDIWWIEEGKDYPRLWWELGDEAAP
jgi:hypothetical protein